MCLNLPRKKKEIKTFPILLIRLCPMFKGKNLWLTSFWKLSKENPYSANGFSAHMWQTPPTTWWNILARRTPSPSPLFSPTPVKHWNVRTVELNSLWIMDMQCTRTPTTDSALIVIIALWSFPKMSKNSWKFTWNWAQPRAMVIPIAAAHCAENECLYSLIGFVWYVKISGTAKTPSAIGKCYGLLYIDWLIDWLTWPEKTVKDVAVGNRWLCILLYSLARPSKLSLLISTVKLISTKYSI